MNRIRESIEAAARQTQTYGMGQRGILWAGGGNMSASGV